jgi:hypothetical protein
MNQKPFIGVYWKARKETHRECVMRTLEFLKTISNEPNLMHWFSGGTSKCTGELQELSIAAIGRQMTPVTTTKKFRGDLDPNLTDELGFGFGAWNGNHNAGASVLITCGSHNPHQSNVVAFKLFRQPFPGDQESKDRFRRLLDTCIKTWDPDFAVVTTSERNDLAFGDRNKFSQKEWEECMTKSAWLLYKRGQPIVVKSDI